ncbi:MAG: hypothetical protein LBL69_03180 [Zoogloeaceae bacterium]|nr:hypothetical protein [Zoogloeaceae bacterium]
MSTTQADIDAMNKEIDAIAEEFSRLNSLFDAQLKALGLTENDLKRIDPNNPPPELAAQVAEAVSVAKRAGAERAGQARTAAAAAKSSGHARPRAGAIRL